MRDNLVQATGKAPIMLSALREARAAPGSGEKCRFKPTYCLWRVCAMRQAGGNDLRRETSWAVETDCHRQLKRVRQSEKKRRGGFCQVSSEGDQFVTGGDNAWKFETLHQCAWMRLWGR